MTTTVQEVRREMLRRGPAELGRIVPITSLTTTTITVSQLATGTVSTEKFQNKWLTRGEASTAADRVRVCAANGATPAFTSSTGVFSHAGANYSDTTATDEELEILEHEPYLYDEAINVSLGKTRRLYEVEVPARAASRHWLANWLANFSWLRQPGDVRKVELVHSPQLTVNRYLQNRSTYSAGVLQPDGWSLIGNNATMAYSATQIWGGGQSLAITRAGTNATLFQTIPHALNTGVGEDSLRGQTVGMFARVWSSVASQVRLQVTDGVDTTNSSYHTGGSGWEELSLSHEVDSAATKVTFALLVESDNTVAYVGEAVGFWGTIHDGLRRGNSHTTPYWDARFDQSGSSLSIDLPNRGYGGHWRIIALRPYPQLDWTRLAAGSDETTTIDAPLDILVAGGLAHLYLKLSGMTGVDTTRFKELATIWMFKWEQLARSHIYEPGGPGIPLGRKPLAYAARRP